MLRLRRPAVLENTPCDMALTTLLWVHTPITVSIAVGIIMKQY